MGRGWSEDVGCPKFDSQEEKNVIYHQKKITLTKRKNVAYHLEKTRVSE